MESPGRRSPTCRHSNSRGGRRISFPPSPELPSGAGCVFVPERRPWRAATLLRHAVRSEEHTSELQSLMRLSYAVFCLKKKKLQQHTKHTQYTFTEAYIRLE